MISFILESFILIAFANSLACIISGIVLQTLLKATYTTVSRHAVAKTANFAAFA